MSGGISGTISAEAATTDAAKYGHTCITKATLKDLSAPAHLNSGELEDIYKQRLDDFEEPQTLEVSYEGPNGIQHEIVFVDPVYADKRPRICVSVDGIQAMHNAISVLSRKVDNLVSTLKKCRTEYYAQLNVLRQKLEAKSFGELQSLVDQDPAQIDDLNYFDPEKYVEDRADLDIAAKTKKERDQWKEKFFKVEAEMHRLEKIEQKHEMEIKVLTEKVTVVAEPTTIVQELLTGMNTEALLRTVREAMQDSEKDIFTKALETVLKETSGSSITYLDDELKAEQRRRSDLEIKLAKNDKDLKAALEKQIGKAKQELEDLKKSHSVQVRRIADRLEETQKEHVHARRELTTVTEENEKLNRECSDQKKFFEVTIGRERDRADQAEHLISELTKQLEGGSGINKAIFEARQRNTMRTADDHAAFTIAKYNERDRLLISNALMRSTNEDVQGNFAIDSLQGLSEKGRSRALERMLASSEEVMVRAATKLPSPTQADIINRIWAADGTLDAADLTAKTPSMPLLARKHIVVEALKDASVGDDSDEERPANQSTAPAVFDPVRDLSKKARRGLIVRLIKNMSATEVKALPERFGAFARKNILSGVLEDSHPDDMKALSRILESNSIALSAISDGLSPDAKKRMAGDLLRVMSQEELEAAADGTDSQGMDSLSSLTRQNTQARPQLARQVSNGKVRRDSLRIQAACQTDISGVGVPLQVGRPDEEPTIEDRIGRSVSKSIPADEPPSSRPSSREGMLTRQEAGEINVVVTAGDAASQNPSAEDQQAEHEGSPGSIESRRSAGRMSVLDLLKGGPAAAQFQFLKVEQGAKGKRSSSLRRRSAIDYAQLDASRSSSRASQSPVPLDSQTLTREYAGSVHARDALLDHNTRTCEVQTLLTIRDTTEPASAKGQTSKKASDEVNKGKLEVLSPETSSSSSTEDKDSKLATAVAKELKALTSAYIASVAPESMKMPIPSVPKRKVSNVGIAGRGRSNSRSSLTSPRNARTSRSPQSPMATSPSPIPETNPHEDDNDEGAPVVKAATEPDGKFRSKDGQEIRRKSAATSPSESSDENVDMDRELAAWLKDAEAAPNEEAATEKAGFGSMILRSVRDGLLANDQEGTGGTDKEPDESQDVFRASLITRKSQCARLLEAAMEGQNVGGRLFEALDINGDSLLDRREFNRAVQSGLIGLGSKFTAALDLGKEREERPLAKAPTKPVPDTREFGVGVTESDFEQALDKNNAPSSDTGPSTETHDGKYCPSCGCSLRQRLQGSEDDAQQQRSEAASPTSRLRSIISRSPSPSSPARKPRTLARQVSMAESVVEHLVRSISPDSDSGTQDSSMSPRTVLKRETVMQAGWKPVAPSTLTDTDAAVKPVAGATAADGDPAVDPTSSTDPDHATGRKANAAKRSVHGLSLHERLKAQDESTNTISSAAVNAAGLAPGAAAAFANAGNGMRTGPSRRSGAKKKANPAQEKAKEEGLHSLQELSQLPLLAQMLGESESESRRSSMLSLDGDGSRRGSRRGSAGGSRRGSRSPDGDGLSIVGEGASSPALGDLAELPPPPQGTVAAAPSRRRTQAPPGAAARPSTFTETAPSSFMRSRATFISSSNAPLDLAVDGFGDVHERGRNMPSARRTVVQRPGLQRGRSVQELHRLPEAEEEASPPRATAMTSSASAAALLGLDLGDTGDSFGLTAAKASLKPLPQTARGLKDKGRRLMGESADVEISGEPVKMKTRRHGSPQEVGQLQMTGSQVHVESAQEDRKRGTVKEASPTPRMRGHVHRDRSRSRGSIIRGRSSDAALRLSSKEAVSSTQAINEVPEHGSQDARIASTALDGLEEQIRLTLHKTDADQSPEPAGVGRGSVVSRNVRRIPTKPALPQAGVTSEELMPHTGVTSRELMPVSPPVAVIGPTAIQDRSLSPHGHRSQSPRPLVQRMRERLGKVPLAGALDIEGEGREGGENHRKTDGAVVLPQIVSVSKAGTGSQTARDMHEQKKLDQRLRLQKLRRAMTQDEVLQSTRQVQAQSLMLGFTPQDGTRRSLEGRRQTVKDADAPHAWPQPSRGLRRGTVANSGYHAHGAEPASVLVDRVRDQLERSYGSVALAWDAIAAGAAKLPSQQLCQGQIKAGVFPDDAAYFVQAILEGSTANDPFHGTHGLPHSEVRHDDFLSAFRPGGLRQITLDAVKLPSLEIASCLAGDKPNIRVPPAHGGGISHRDPRTSMLQHSH